MKDTDSHLFELSEAENAPAEGLPESLAQLVEAGKPLDLEHVNRLVVRTTISNLIRHGSDLEDRLRDLEEDRRHEMRRILLSLLRVADSLDRIIKHGGSDQDMFSSVNALRNQFLQLLEEQDVCVVEISAGDRFDAATCEVSITEERGDIPPDTILTVERRGYLWKEKILRRARVVIAVEPKS